jgi:hypothetical protein
VLKRCDGCGVFIPSIHPLQPDYVTLSGRVLSSAIILTVCVHPVKYRGVVISIMRMCEKRKGYTTTNALSPIPSYCCCPWAPAGSQPPSASHQCSS